MWKVRAGFMCIVNSFIFETSSFVSFDFLVSFLHAQHSTSFASITSARVREIPRAMVESSLDSEI